MRKILKMDLYRMIKSKSLYVLIILTIGVAALMLVTTNLQVKQMKENPQMYQNMQEYEQQESTDVGIVLGASTSWVDDNIKIPFVGLFEVALGSCFLVIFISIFVAGFVNSEQKHGFIKNISGNVPNRGLVALSKIITACIFSVMLFVIFALSMMLMSKIFLGYVNFSGFSDALPSFGIQLLLHVAVGIVVAAFAVILNSGSFSMTIGILMATGIPNLLGMGINSLLKLLFSLKDFDITKYFLSPYLSLVGSQSSSSQQHWAIAVSVIYIAVFAVFAFSVMKKRDVK